MTTLFFELLAHSASQSPKKEALVHNSTSVDYESLEQLVREQALAFKALGLKSNDRVAIYLPKQLETVSSFIAATAAGGCFVPINHVLKAPQVAHILGDCDVKILVTSAQRMDSLQSVLSDCPKLEQIVLVDDGAQSSAPANASTSSWLEYLERGRSTPGSFPTRIDSDMAAILYTSGSTGKPKGVVVSHRNLVAGAQSVAEYLHLSESDRILAVLPFSFDYGLNQLVSSLLVGATCVLLDYLLPRDVVKAVDKHQITGLAAVPPLWAQLVKLDWPSSIDTHLCYMTNSGGKMPVPTLEAIRGKAPSSKFYLMYGLTEAFRSTYLSPEQIDQRPDSIGKAIPNAEILVVNQDGSLCQPGESGELVHRGVHVAMGYWNDPEKTALRFRKSPVQLSELPQAETAVWSGDTVKMDEEGYLYFVGRQDDMIKTSGYRVSPTEVEDIVFASGLVSEAAALGIPHADLGQGIVIVAKPHETADEDAKLLEHCRREMPSYMIPKRIVWRDELPRSPNGKIDRGTLSLELNGLFDAAET